MTSVVHSWLKRQRPLWHLHKILPLSVVIQIAVMQSKENYLIAFNTMALAINRMECIISTDIQ